MNEYGYNEYDNDTEIDLVDLIFYFLRKWKMLLLAVVIGAVLGGGFCALRSARSHSEAVQTEAKTEKDYEIDDDVLDNMGVAYRLRLEYLRQKEYNENSVLMKINPNAYYMGTLKYFIPSGENASEIALLYQDILNQYEFYEDLASATGMDAQDSAYVKELVRVLFDETVPLIVRSDVAILDQGESSPAAGGLSDSEEEMSETAEPSGIIYAGGMITYIVVGETEDACEQMLEVIRKKVKALDKSCELQYSGYKVNEMGEAVQLVSNSNYLTNQKTNVDQMNTNLSNAVKLESAFSDEELEYYNKVYWSENKSEETSDETEPGAEGTAAEAETGEDSASSFKISKRSLMKWVILGIFGGIMVWGCCYLVVYLMDSSVKTVGELRDSYHLPLLGHVSVEGNGKKSWIDRLYSKVKGSPDTVPYIVSEIDTMEKGPIALCGDKEYNDVQAVMVELAENCEEVSANDFASKSTAALQKAKEAGAEILVVRLGRTRRAEIRRELEVCRMQNVKVAGIVAVEDA